MPVSPDAMVDCFIARLPAITTLVSTERISAAPANSIVTSTMSEKINAAPRCMTVAERRPVNIPVALPTK